MQLQRQLSAAAVWGAAALAGAPVAGAQQTTPGPAQTQQPATQRPGSSIPDQKLNAAAAAIVSVAQVRRDYEQRIAAASSAADKSRIAEQGSDALQKAVTDHGLSVDEYDNIIKVARNDPAVRSELIRRVKASGK